MEETTPMKGDVRANLDSPPPGSGRTKGTLLDSKKKDEGGAAPPQSPQMMALQGMGMLKQGARLLSVALPGLAPALMQMTSQLEEVIPRALAESLGGGEGSTPMAAPPPPPGMEAQVAPGQ